MYEDGNITEATDSYGTENYIANKGVAGNFSVKGYTYIIDTNKTAPERVVFISTFTEMGKK